MTTKTNYWNGMPLSRITRTVPTMRSNSERRSHMRRLRAAPLRPAIVSRRLPAPALEGTLKRFG